MKKTNAIRILDQRKISYEMVSYKYDPENLSVEKIAAANDLEVEKVFKTLVANGDKNGIIIAVVSGDQNLNFKSLAKVSGNKKIALVQIKKLLDLTGYIRGGCSPIGMKKQYPVFVDVKANELKEIYINAGARGLLVKLNIQDLQKISNATITKITLP